MKNQGLFNGLLVGLNGAVSDVSVWEMGSETNREWRLSFHEEFFDFLSSEEDRNKVLVRHFNEVDSFILTMPFPSNSVVESGAVVLTVNNLKWAFEVPRQKPNWGVITMHRVKGKPEVMRIPVLAFVFPPRWTNRWYQ